MINCSFFSYETNRSLDVVIKDGQLLAYNQHTLFGKGKDTFTYRHPVGSAIGISKKRKADIAWLITDSSAKYAYASQTPFTIPKDSVMNVNYAYYKHFQTSPIPNNPFSFRPWKMRTAVGGGPVLLQDGQIKITGEEEVKFTGKAFQEKHPRTAIGYKADGKLVILMIEGRNSVAHGATLTQEAQIFKDLGCVEALNLDGGGSSCMLINGKPTITVSDKAGQRPVPAVFLVKMKK